MSRAAAVLLCAGGSTRMGFDKLLTPLAGKTATEHSLDALLAGGAELVVCAVSPATRAFAESLGCPVEKIVVSGGAVRAESVRLALAAVRDADVVAIHDAARCMVSPDTVRACFETARTFGSGIAVARMTDTVMRISGGVTEPMPREELVRMQTPQTFRLDLIRAAYAGDLTGATDDCSVFLRAGHTPSFVYTSEGENEKLTTAADWERALAAFARFGTGYDTHRLAEGRPLILGGVELPFEKGLLGHSDADVLTHAVMDALLGAAGLGDIGKLFPDSDPAYAGADSILLLREVVRILQARRLRVMHVDATVIAERPKLAPYLSRMRERLARAMDVSPDAVSIKATTTEGMNDEGRGLCISAEAIASVV